MPVELDSDITYVAQRVGVSRSALLVSLLAEPVGDMRRLLEELPAHPSPDDVVRARGRSHELVEQRLEGLRRLENDLFSN